MSLDLNITDKGKLCRAYYDIFVKGCGDGDFFALKHVAFRNGTQGVSFLNNIRDNEFGNIFADYFKLEIIFGAQFLR